MKNQTPSVVKKDARPWMVRSRVGVLRTAAVVLALALLFTRRRWTESPALEELLETSGLLLAVVGTFIRTYAALFIYGRKTTSLVTVGPYSVVRNPLYVGSFVAAVGLAIRSGSVTVLGAVAILFMAYYPVVIENEEARLRSLHKDKFEKYSRQTPALLPQFRLFREPDYAVVNTRKLKWAYLEGLGFISGVIGLSLIEVLQDLGIFYPLFRLP